MPRSIQEILESAETLAAKFAAHEADPTTILDARALRDLRRAFQARANAEFALAAAVARARTDGHSWSAIGAMVGTSGEAARQKYGGGVGTVAKQN